jgi:hypothetical protein
LFHLPSFCPECGTRLSPADHVCPQCGTQVLPDPIPEPVILERPRATKVRELVAVITIFSIMVAIIMRSYASSQGEEPTRTPAAVAAVTVTPTAIPELLALGSVPPKVTSETTASFSYTWTDPSGGQFECRLDAEQFTSCDPNGKQYEQLPQGIHTFQVRVIRPNGVPTNAVSYGWRIDFSVPELSFFPDGGTYATKELVAIQSSKPGKIYYTTDGSDPTTASTAYTDPILVQSATTIKAVAVDDTGNASKIASASYAFQPEFHDDFEDGSLANWSNVTNLIIDDQGGLNSQRAARAISTDGSPAWASIELSQPVNDLYVQAAVLLRSRGGNPVALMRIRDSNDNVLVTLYVTTTGKLGVLYGTTASATTGLVVRPGQWNEIELHVSVVAGRTVVEVWYNGTYIEDLHLTSALVASPLSTLQIGESANKRLFDISYDNVITDTTFIPSAFLVVESGPNGSTPIAVGEPQASPAAQP